jgi:hypothetical protein
MQKFYRFALASLVLAIIVGVVAWGQKKEESPEEGITLADLGVTEEQKAQIKALWALKRRQQIQAIENLRILNRLSKDAMASDDEIQETLRDIRRKHSEFKQKIEASEARLIETLPPRAQLHLMILGVLDNGLTPRYLKKEERTENNGEQGGP